MAAATVSLFILTWNLGSQGPSPTLNLNELLNLNSGRTQLPDIYVIGLQEGGVRTTGSWETLFQNTLYPYGYVQVKTEKLVEMMVQFFIKLQHLGGIQNLETVTTANGLMDFVGNKGGVALRLDLYGASVCLVNCHLAAHDEQLNERVEDYNAIISNTRFKAPTNEIMLHDYVFWFGDLNMRLEGSATAADVAAAVSRNDLANLFREDQLTKVRSANLAFTGMKENRPNFPPTFKFSSNSQQYNIKRKPAWTDRVLFKDNPMNGLVATQAVYKSVMSYTFSDHRPVIAQFTVKVPSLETKLKVTFLPVGIWYVNEHNTAKVQLAARYSTRSSSDWIGVFPAYPISLQSYVSFIYMPSAQAGTTTSLSFPSSVGQPGYHRLIYFTATKDVLGVSEPFCVIDRDNPMSGPCRAQGN